MNKNRRLSAQEARAEMYWERHSFQICYSSDGMLGVAAVLKTRKEAEALIRALSVVWVLLPETPPAASGNDAEARCGEKREVGKPESL